MTKFLLPCSVRVVLFLFVWSPVFTFISEENSEIVVSTSAEDEPDSVQGIYCFDPGNLQFGHRQPEFRLYSPLPSGSQLHFVCLPGYKLNGSRKMVCGDDGNWAPSTKPICQKVVCPVPHIENGHILASKLSDYYDSGTTVQVVCKDGYRLRNKYHDMIECRLGGNWMVHNSHFPLEHPICIEHTCSTPPQILNGKTQIQGNLGLDGGYKQNSAVTYHCDNGFQFEDLRGSRLFCRNGFWVPENLEISLSRCVQGGCSHPLPIANGYFIPLYTSMYPYGTQITYYCQKDFTLTRQVQVYRCMPDGLWFPSMQEDSVPVCHHQLAIGCPEPPYIANGIIDKINNSMLSTTKTYPENTVATYICDSGYRFHNCLMNWMVCKGGNWVNPTPICVELEGCGSPPAVPFAIVSRQDLTVPAIDDYTYPLYTKVHYKCLPGFQLLGTPDLICNLEGCWSPNLPQCILTSASYESEWNFHPSLPSPESETNDYNWSDSHLITVSVATAGSIIGALLLIQIVVLFQRKKCCIHRQHLHLHSHRRHSSSVSLPSSPCHMSSTNDPDRVALIAFADGVQVVLPTYEEAIRQTGPPPFEALNGVHRGRWSRGMLPSLPSTRRCRMTASMRDNSTETTNGPTRQSSSASQSASFADSFGSTDTVANSEVSTTVTLDTLSSNTSNTSQPMSCRAVCGSLASFDTTSMMNTEGVPLLEENEMETSEEATDNNKPLLQGTEYNTVAVCEPNSSDVNQNTSD